MHEKNFNENVDEIVPTRDSDTIQPILDKPVKKRISTNAEINKASQERNKKLKRRKRERMAKASRRRNRKSRK